MAFWVKYEQDVPQNCSECPCSVHVTKNEVYCNARQKHFVVADNRPDECKMMYICMNNEGEMYICVNNKGDKI